MGVSVNGTPETREGMTMAYVITEPCIDVKDKACVEVCPVDCIYEGPNQLFIHPDECIDCGACEPVCPVKAIFTEDETPEPSKQFINLNKQFFVDNPRIQPCTTKGYGKLGARGAGAARPEAVALGRGRIRIAAELATRAVRQDETPGVPRRCQFKSVLKCPANAFQGLSARG